MNNITTLIEIKNAAFLESDIRQYSPDLALGWFAVALDGLRRKRIYLAMYHTDPETGKAVRNRSYSEDAAIIKNLVPGDFVNLVVNAWDWTKKDARTDTYSLAHIRAIN
jgi:hypothetical protein